MTVEFWCAGHPVRPRDTAAKTRRAEKDGYDGIVFGDTQNLMADVFVQLASAVNATARIKVASRVAVPYTRHPAVLAGGLATLQELSGGRVVLGMGRGDSALAHLGLAPGTFASYERYITRLQGYLRGDDVPFDPLDVSEGLAPISKLEIGQVPTMSRLQYLDPSVPKVPLEVHAAGPRAMRMAARHAERLTFVVGADPKRVAWAAGLADRACEDGARDPADLVRGALVTIVPHPDRATARRLAGGSMASSLRVSAQLGELHGPLDNRHREVVRQVLSRYDMNAHSTSGTPQQEVLPDDFIDSYYIVGPAEHCVQRIHDLVGLGLSWLHLTSFSIDVNRQPSQTEIRGIQLSRELLATEVMPAVRATATGATGEGVT
jgi:5,10-methylenetetrahydromethanopterin reductase